MNLEQKYAFATHGRGVLVIQVTNENISFGEGIILSIEGIILSIINMNETFIALCTHNGIEVHNKETQ